MGRLSVGLVDIDAFRLAKLLLTANIVRPRKANPPTAASKITIIVRIPISKTHLHAVASLGNPAITPLSR
jgi:hypothetical protein